MQPDQTSTARRASAQAAMSDAWTAWEGLSVSQRAGWYVWARSLEAVDSLGVMQQREGPIVFLSHWMALTAAGLPPLDDPPVAAPVWHMTGFQARVNGVGTLVYDGTMDDSAAGFHLRLWSAGYGTPTTMSPPGRGRWWIPIGVQAISPGLSFTYILGSLVEAVFGSLQPGRKIWVQARELSAATGLYGPPLRGSVIVP